MGNNFVAGVFTGAGVASLGLAAGGVIGGEYNLGSMV